MSRNNVPDIRFEGFQGEWNSTSLKDFSQKVTSKNISLRFSTVFTNSAEYGIIDQKEYFDRNVANDSSINGYYVVEPNDFVYNPRISTSAPVGPINRNKYSYAGVISPLYYVFKTNESIDLTYLDVYFKSTMWHSFMYMNGNSGARSDRFSISDDVFVGMPISHPHSVDEQQKIGKLFATLDKLIRQLELKLEKLRRIKQSLLQQMFINVNRGGCAVAPQIRFVGFSEPWNMTKLGEIFGERNERSANGELISVTMSKGVVKASELDRIDKSSNDKSNYKVVRKGDIAYNSMRMWQGACGYSLYDGILSPAYTVVFPYKDLSVEYFHYLFKRQDSLCKFRINSQGLTSDTWNLKYPNFSKIVVIVPQKDEQIKIADVFLKADALIEHQEHSLSKLRTMKQSLLEKMFVK